MHVAPFDIREIPFSRRGSWLDLSPVVGLHDHRDDIHLVSHQTGMHPIFRLTPSDPSATVSADVSSFTWESPRGRIDAVFETLDTLRVRGRGMGLVLEDAADGLTPFTGTYAFVDPIDGSTVFTSYETGRRYRITVLAGRAEVTGDQLLGSGRRSVAIVPDDGAWEAVVEEFETTRPPYTRSGSFDDAVRAVTDEFRAYADRIAPWAAEGDASTRAAYVLWSATVAPRGFLRRESILMSKHWMDKVWSWDHCFNALALSAGLPDEAMDQFLVVFDQQDEHGGLPDSVTHSEVLDNFVKPPIHGWAFRRLRARLAHPLDPARLAEVYQRLSGWTGFWLDRRRVAGHALPHYQHGNDSGWDNSSMFDRDRVVEAPDLAAFLVVQLDVLAGLAEELGHPSARWRDEATAIRGALLAALGRERVRRPASDDRASEHDDEPAESDADRGGRSAPSRCLGCDGGGHSRPSDGVGPRHRATRLRSVRRRRLLAGTDLGAVHRADRGRSTAQRPRRPRRRDHPPVPPTVRTIGLRRELRCAHRGRAPRPCVHLDGERVPAARGTVVARVRIPSGSATPA